VVSSFALVSGMTTLRSRQAARYRDGGRSGKPVASDSTELTDKDGSALVPVLNVTISRTEPAEGAAPALLV
jgi:hypothetical protein